MRETQERDYLEGSLIFSFLRRFWGRIQLPLGRAWMRLRRSGWMSETIEGFRQSPLRAGGLVLIAAILTNLLLSWILGKEIPGFGWLFRGMLLLAGIAGLRCPGDWESIREGSALLRFFFPREPR